jgi:predicted Zn-dependent protease with MMP-like domain
MIDAGCQSAMIRVMHRRTSRIHGTPAGGITRRERELFDREFKRVLRALPAAARESLQAVPVVVDDCPSAEVQSEMGVAGDDLFGLYTGTPLIERSIDHVGAPADVIHIYRLALLRDAATRDGAVDRNRLREQIRVTLLHELGHYHGFDEDRLEELGY